MSVPVIDQTVSLAGVERTGQFFRFLPSATNTPTSWSIGLTSDALAELGLKFNTTTGLLSGAFKAPGFYAFSLYATNGDGTSVLPLVLRFGVWIEAEVAEPTFKLDVNLDQNGKVTSLAGDPPLKGKHGDQLVIDVGFKQGGALIDAPLQRLKIGLVEFMEDPLVADLNDGNFAVIGDENSRRFRIVADLNNAALKSLLNAYQNDKDEFFTAVAELEWMMMLVVTDGGEPQAVIGSSPNFNVEIAADIVPNS